MRLLVASKVNVIGQITYLMVTSVSTILNSSFDWNGIREPFVIATENDSLNGVNMLFGKMLTGQAQVFCDVRTYWSQDSVERVSGYRPEAGFIHLVNSGSAALDGSGEAKDQHGESVIKPHWDMSAEDAEACLSATCYCQQMSNTSVGVVSLQTS